MGAERWDAVVVGAGLGGLLAAARLAQAGRRALVLERLPWPGGRFTTTRQEGCELTTGALHLVPHGDGGPLAALLQDLGVPIAFVERTLPASFALGGRQIPLARRRDLLALLSWRGRLDLLRIGWHLRRRESAPEASFGGWLEGRTRDPLLRRMFAVFCEFALSVRLSEIAYEEMRAVIRSVFRHGLPRIPAGGCRTVVEALVRYLHERGGAVRTGARATALLRGGDGAVAGVRFAAAGRVEEASAPLVVCDAGPRAAAALLGRAAAAETVPAARGLKLHLLCQRSWVPHNSILFPLDARRISGIVEVSRAVPASAPEGRHLLDTFQVPRSRDTAEEKALAREDLRAIFGSGFDRQARLLRASAFRAPWPVNRARQGLDLHEVEPVPGLLLVGDACKPSGLMMVEGVAGSVRRIEARLGAGR